MMGGVRLGFEGLHGLMGCSQGYMTGIGYGLCALCRTAGGVRNALWRCDDHAAGGWEWVNWP
eukprot:856330-Prorocentrum_minimum.AAC.4